MVIGSRRTGHIPRVPQPCYSMHRPILKFPFLWVLQIFPFWPAPNCPREGRGGRGETEIHKYTLSLNLALTSPTPILRQLHGNLTLKQDHYLCGCAAMYSDSSLPTFRKDILRSYSRQDLTTHRRRNLQSEHKTAI